MGLLDDAIREHLELKRRHGANPEEVSRQEREALGAPVRGEFAQPRAGEEPSAPAEGDEDRVAAVPASEVEGELEPAEPAEPAEAPDEVAPPPEDAAAPAPGHDEDPWLVEDLADPPRSRTDAPAEEAEDPEGEDVLEEMPDFLPETPEHERLWFEQKPPRDFDWDK